MAYIGAVPTAVPLTGADIEDGTIGVADLSSTLDFSSKTITLPSGTGGKVLQFVSTTKTDPFTSNLTSFNDVTGLTVSITPSSSSNKVLIFLNFIVSCQTNARLININLLRGSTNIGQPASSGATTHAYNVDSDNANHVALHYLDSPATTSATTYKVQIKTNNTDNYVSIGDRNSGDLDCISVISAMEISA